MRKRHCVTMALLMIGILVSATGARAQVPVGSLTAVMGTATITRAGRTTFASYGDAVNVGDRVTTGSDGRVTITLSDNTQMQVIESSTIVVTEVRFNPNGSRASTKIDLAGGTVRSLVRFTGGNAPNFEVHTPNAIAAAHGTTYDTAYASGVTRKGYETCRNFTDVLVYNGTVMVSNPSSAKQPPVLVHPGEKSVAPCGQTISPAQALNGARSKIGAAGIAAIGTVGVTALGGGLAGIVTGTGGSSGQPDDGSGIIPKTPASPSD
jgi:FecR protein